MSFFMPAVYVLVPTVAAVIGVLLAGLAWNRRPAPGATPFTFVFLSAAFWSFAYTMELLATDFGSTLFWGKTSYFGILVLPVVWTVFALEYTGHERWSRPETLGALMVVPIVVTALVWTSPDHDLIWTSIVPVTFEGMLILEYHYGPAFYVTMAYAYLLLAVGVALFVRHFLRVPSYHHKRVGAILVGAVLPLASNALFNFGFRPSPPINLTHLGFAIAGLLYFWAFFQFGLMDLRSVARERVFESLELAIVLLSPTHRVVDLNAAAEALFDVAEADVIGRPFQELLPADVRVFVDEGDRIYNDEIELDVDGEPRRFAVDLTSMYYPIQQQTIGRILVFREESESGSPPPDVIGSARTGG